MLRRTISKLCVDNPLKFLDKRIEEMKRSNRLPPKKEALILYRHCVKTSKRFFWKRMDGKDWHIFINLGQKLSLKVLGWNLNKTEIFLIH